MREKIKEGIIVILNEELSAIKTADGDYVVEGVESAAEKIITELEEN